MGYAMDGFSTLDLALFAAGAFAAAFVTGLAGFAFGIVAAAVWLHFLAPAQAAALIVAYGLIVQGVSVWKLRRAVKWPRLLPFLIGGATGLAGIAGVIWSSLRGWPPPEQRAVFQPAGVAVFAMTALWLGGTGMIGGDTLALFLIGLPALALGTWAGLKLFGKLDDAAFRRIVLAAADLGGEPPGPWPVDAKRGAGSRLSLGDVLRPRLRSAIGKKGSACLCRGDNPRR